MTLMIKKTKYTKNKILKYLLWNLFLQTDETLDFKSLTFREGQLEIIKNVLSRKDTIGLWLIIISIINMLILGLITYKFFFV